MLPRGSATRPLYQEEKRIGFCYVDISTPLARLGNGQEGGGGGGGDNGGGPRTPPPPLEEEQFGRGGGQAGLLLPAE